MGGRKGESRGNWRQLAQGPGKVVVERRRGEGGRRKRTAFLATRVFFINSSRETSPRRRAPRRSSTLARPRPASTPQIAEVSKPKWGWGGGSVKKPRNPATRVLPTSRTRSLPNTEALRETAASQSYGESTQHFSRKQNIRWETYFAFSLYSLGGCGLGRLVREVRFVQVGYCLLMDQPLGEGLF